MSPMRYFRGMRLREGRKVISRSLKVNWRFDLGQRGARRRLVATSCATSASADSNRFVSRRR